MPSSDAAAVVLGAAFALATCTSCPDANAQQAVGGYAVERLVASPAGAGWFALDNLELQGGLGGAAGISFGYAKDSLTLTSSRSPTALTVVAHEALTDFSFAATYDRFRVSLAFQMPLIVKGQSGVIDGYQYSGPSLDAGVNPDTMADARLGVDARLWGGVHDAFRLGVGGTLVVQSGQRSFYVTDGTWRGMVRVLAAGDEVIAEGAPGTEAFIVARGELEVRRASHDPSEPIVLARLQSGQVFGEMALVSRAPRAASVVAVRPSLVLAAPVEQLESVATRNPEVGEQLATFCRERMLQNLLRTSPILRAVDPAERGDLVGRFETQTFEAGQFLMKRGDVATGLHMIASGEVEVATNDASGERLKIATLGPGDVVGEVAMILRRPHGADVVALHPTVTLHLPGPSFQEMLRAHPTLLAELYDLAIKRDEETTSVVAQEAASADEFVIV